MIILIDDNPIDNFLAKRVLENSGFEGSILVKDSGKQALDHLKLQFTEPKNWPNLIFLDINMPVMDGYAFLYEFRKIPSQIREKTKIVILSSSDNMEDLSKLIDHDL
ncbi:MAG TPA: response regulator, partial [Cytophagaceae bacterium]